MAARENGLPPKESTLFKSIVKHYETKQYKKGLKAADTVLKKFPEHGETLAMKGLLLNCVDKKQEAYELVRRGVKQDIKSQVCWHVYGLLYRSDREYLQAIKCYRGALRHDPENMKILRDLSMLQVQMRDLPGFLQTRQTLLTIKPTNRMHWFTFAVSQHLMKRYSQAISVVDAYEKTLEGAPENEYEHSEMLLYKNMLHEEGGNVQAALQHLDSCESQVVDKSSWSHKRGLLLLQLRRFDEAKVVFNGLLARNPEHYAYHAGLQAAELRTATVTERWLCTDVPADTERTLRKLYEQLIERFPRSMVCRRLPLDFARDRAYFIDAFSAYALPYIRKGVPSLFADIKPLSVREEKREQLSQTIKGWVSSLEADGCFPGNSEREMPSSIMWVRVLAAQHADQCGDTVEALRQINLAIEHTPTCLDLYLFKARIYKHAGDRPSASKWMDEARKMDLADRYLNTKATRYMLRADQFDEATKTIALFTKDGDQNSNLFDMQCMWFELESAYCHLRLGYYGRALKQFTAVEKHFNDIVEDQFDFHTYCVRKMTLRSYVKLLRLEDNLWGHDFFVNAACGIIETYLRIADKPKSTETTQCEEQNDELSAAERKKAESKRRRMEAKAKAEAEAQARKDAPAGASGKGDKGKKPAKDKSVDDDPDGVALAEVEAPLDKASTYLRTLQLHAPKELRTHTYGCELAMRKRKYLLALRSLRKAVALAPDDPRVHRYVVRFLHIAQTETLPPVIEEVVSLQREALGLLPGTSLVQFNEAFATRLPHSNSAQIVAAEMHVLLMPDQKKAALQRVLELDVSQFSLQDCVDMHSLIANTLHDASAAENFKQHAHERFPYATVFLPVEVKSDCHES
mmetsp:Transcript_26195/g.43350  ORF Transcript_26195/g.43350 Transcript_26195/m.43350 type:complete len:859 (+) Transcript_26195:51-2627(+)|eukprot:CAMPEP_0119330706 /NCGR_PEP_ID=MMETSP1333-20130426/78838_1 /TAXON_ID=418940 /ORGANISM="Scyphosphaera apsteinii, Strain RCC1455" /LENGTH=858 /DNA_ID=CAMNT_0007340141 /DNA_START=43 /DNA_END=2619 /DNA_ORIENTATION=+